MDLKEIDALKVEYVPLKSIKAYKRNAKLHPPEQIEEICESIRLCANGGNLLKGFKDPIGVWHGEIVEGHGRYMAAKELGLETVPIIRLDDMTDDQRRAYMLIHNKTTMDSGWDMELLDLELGDIELDMEPFGFETEGDEEPAEVVEDEAPEDVETRCKLGDIWQLGEHRLICGDSTDVTVIDRLMDGVKADMVFTDPPYGMKKESEGVLNDNLNFDDLLDFNRQWIPLTFGALKDNGSWYCWGIDEPLMDIYSNILKPMQRENKITFRNLITWDKGNGQGQLSEDFRMYPIADEKCLFVMMGKWAERGFGLSQNVDNYYNGFEIVRLFLVEQKGDLTIHQIKDILGHSDKSRDHWFTKSQWELINENNYNKLKEYCKAKGINAFEADYKDVLSIYEKQRSIYNGEQEIEKGKRPYFDNTHDNMNNVWHFDRTSQEERTSTGGHATPKPIALCSRAIKSSSREGEIVLDVFGGSGSTLIACEQLNRKCYMCELDPHYCDVIIQRWENLTGEKAVLLNEG